MSVGVYKTISASSSPDGAQLILVAAGTRGCGGSTVMGTAIGTCAVASTEPAQPLIAMVRLDRLGPLKCLPTGASAEQFVRPSLARSWLATIPIPAWR